MDITRQIPGLVLAHIDSTDDSDVVVAAVDLLTEIVTD